MLAPASKADLAFTMHMLSWLSTAGTAAIIEFPGVLYRGAAEQKIRQYLVSNNYVDSVILLPQNLFFGTSIATCIIVLKKNKSDNRVCFIDASNEFVHEGNKNNIQGAPVLMVELTVNKRAGYERDGSYSTSKKDHWQSFDAGMAAQVFCLAAHEKGLGTVVMGIYDEEKVKEVLGIGEDKSVSALIALGYPADAPAAPKRKEVADLLTFM